MSSAKTVLSLAGPRARRRARSAARGPRRSPSCRRRGRRSAPGCSWSCARGSGSRGGSRRRGRSPGRACRCAPRRRGRGRTSPAPRRRVSGVALVTRWLPRTSVSTSRSRSRVTPCSRSRRPAAVCAPASIIASRRCSTETYSSLRRCGLLLGARRARCASARETRTSPDAPEPLTRGRPLELPLEVAARSRVDVDVHALQQARDQPVGSGRAAPAAGARRRPRCARSAAPSSARRAAPPGGLLRSAGSGPCDHLVARSGSSRRFQLVDAGEQLAGQHRAGVAQAEVAAQPRGAREARGGGVAACRRRLEQAERARGGGRAPGATPASRASVLDLDRARAPRGGASVAAISRSSRGSNFDVFASCSKSSRSFARELLRHHDLRRRRRGRRPASPSPRSRSLRPARGARRDLQLALPRASAPRPSRPSAASHGRDAAGRCRRRGRRPGSAGAGARRMRRSRSPRTRRRPGRPAGSRIAGRRDAGGISTSKSRPSSDSVRRPPRAASSSDSSSTASVAAAPVEAAEAEAAGGRARGRRTGPRRSR